MMDAYVNSNNELIIVRPNYVYRIGTPKRNAKAIQALKGDKEKNFITELEYMSAMNKLQNNLR